MKYEEALSYINDKDKYGSKLGLESIGRLLSNLENPHKGIKYIHVGGTNGKGSISAYLSSCIQEAGYKVGLFISPYLERFTERIQINGKDIPDDCLGAITHRVKNACEKIVEEGYEHPTTFEIVTAIAFVYYNMEKVDFVVLEVGLGGRYDSTNIIEESVASVIATIDYDHTEVLGKSLSEIAFQKAGIIKENGLVIAYPQQLEAEEVLRNVSREKNAEYIAVDINNLKIISMTYKMSEFNFTFGEYILNAISIKLLGEYQIYNAATAITTLLKLKKMGIIDISEEQLRNGLSKTKWKGRLEVIKTNPIFLIDGAHNLQGITHLAKAVEMFPYEKLILGIGVLKDKDYTHMIEILAPLADKIVVTEVNMPRKLDADILAEELRKYNSEIYVEKNVELAVRKTLELAKKEDMILFGGSLYLIGDVRKIANLL